MSSIRRADQTKKCGWLDRSAKTIVKEKTLLLVSGSCTPSIHNREYNT